MNVTHKQLKAFVAVARSLNFADAGASIHLSQPALSITIKNLEDAVGGRLLSRTTRAVALTPEGEAFFPVAKRLLADWDNAVEALHHRFLLHRDHVAIAAMPSFACNLLPRYIQQFKTDHGDIGVTVHDVIAEDVVALVRSGRVELGVCFEPNDAENLHFHTLFDDQFVAVLPADMAPTLPDVLQWRDLIQNDFILLQRPSGIRLFIEQHLEQHSIHLPTRYEAHQLATIGRMVASGLGVSVVPALCKQQMEEMGAICRPVEGPTVSRKVGILSRAGHPLSEAAAALSACLKGLGADARK